MTDRRKRDGGSYLRFEIRDPRPWWQRLATYALSGTAGGAVVALVLGASWFPFLASVTVPAAVYELLRYRTSRTDAHKRLPEARVLR